MMKSRLQRVIPLNLEGPSNMHMSSAFTELVCTAAAQVCDTGFKYQSYACLLIAFQPHSALEQDCSYPASFSLIYIRQHYLVH